MKRRRNRTTTGLRKIEQDSLSQASGGISYSKGSSYRDDDDYAKRTGG